MPTQIAPQQNTFSEIQLTIYSVPFYYNTLIKVNIPETECYLNYDISISNIEGGKIKTLFSVCKKTTFF